MDTETQIVAPGAQVTTGVDSSGGPFDPASTDPVGSPSDYTLFQADQVYAIFPGESNTDLQGFTISPDLSNLSPSDPSEAPLNNNGGGVRVLAAAAGRILSTPQEQPVYAYNDGSGNIYIAFAGISGPTASLPNWKSTANLGARFVDIASADLDKVTDTEWNNHDEVVVAYVSASGRADQDTVNLAVLDYTEASPDNPQVTAITTATGPVPINESDYETTSSGFILPSDNVLKVGLGDFDGDGLNEIALVYPQDPTTLRLSIFRYTHTFVGGQETRSLTQVSTTTSQVGDPGSYWLVGSIDVATGDFDGDGRDELAVSVVEWNGADEQMKTALYSVYVKMFHADAGLNLIFDSSTTVTSGQGVAFGDNQQPAAHIASGLFQFDSANGFGMERRQLAVACTHNLHGPVYLVRMLSVDTSLQCSQLFDDFIVIGGNADQTFSLAAGGYGGTGSPQSPTWGLVFVQSQYCPYEAGVYNIGQYNIVLIDVESGGMVWTKTSSYPTDLTDFGPRPFVVAYDRDGDSIYLGAPVLLTAQYVINTDFVIQEPPKHAYYDQNAGEVVTVSRYDGFNVELTDSNNITFQSQSTDTSNWTIGGSASITAGASVTAKENLILEKASVTASDQFTAKGSYNYDQNKSSYNSQNAARTVTYTAKTDHDDVLVGRLQVLYIWRYRIYNISNDQSQAPNTFYDVILPGPTVPFEGGGQGYEGYQPVHENGNILSYPADLGGFPEDLGSFTLPDGTTVTQPMIPASQLAFDGTSGTEALEYSTGTGQGASFNYQHTLTESADFKLGFQVDAKEGIFGTGIEESASVEAEAQFNNSNSWGGTNTSNSTSNNATGITLNKISGESAQAYNFYPVFYVTQDGTIKVSFAVDATGNASGEAFWSRLYGSLPDPALNLPGRFNPTYSHQGNQNGWTANLDDGRQKIRGFFLTSPTPDPVTNDYDDLPYAPQDGDQVRIAVRVYNYSLGQATGDFHVNFYAIKYDPSTDTESGNRQPIGQTTVPSLAPLAMSTAALTWDTTGFGPSTPGASQSYRIYVALNADGAVKQEIYPPEDPDKTYPGVVDANGNPVKGVDPGQNNDGWGLATVVAKAASQSEDADVYMKPDSVAMIGAGGELSSTGGEAQAYRPIKLRFTVFASRPGRGFAHLLVYDGDPNRGGQMVADKRVFAGDARVEGNHAWVQWVPTSVGQHHIYASVICEAADATNNMADFVIDVAGPA